MLAVVLLLSEVYNQDISACSHVAGASGEAWKQGNVDFTGMKV